MATLEVIHTYRHLYRALLHAVQFAQPARFVARDRLRRAFREGEGQLDNRSLIRTLRFLEAAARTRGIEHKVLKNLLFVDYHRYYDSRRPWKHVERAMKQPPKQDTQKHIEKTAYKHYDMTVAMLNKSMGLCLR
ncbi:DUF1763-domain-containing protein [Durotheca rogersii]|uniref:DUF1763-domain-containing protein n=1 Tax=Durotheca rogersii TaxID=419775 RepID=UPI00221F276A|nr:DUF1763-domain-containing protein [Durotheca rogersii]KAI5862385.1 DUF1763-domain-containing protein [Durotheca rogersii]